MNGNELAVRSGGVTAADLMPVLDMVQALQRRDFMGQVASRLMREGVDYGAIPGAGAKPTLLKPGAERLITLFGLSPELQELTVIEDWDGEREGRGEPLFYYRYKVRLSRNGILMGEGIGSCSSRESKYRYRTGERVCPSCGKPAIIKGREEYGGGWLCFARKGGCGAKYRAGDHAIEGQSVGRVLNPDVADIVNTVQKMAHKRALVAAVLMATNASEFYTQDIEDAHGEPIDVTPAAPPVATRKEEPYPPDPGGKPWTNKRGMIEAFGALHGRLPGEYAHLYYEVLKNTGRVEHSNQFTDPAVALDTYRQLERIVEELERHVAAGKSDAAEPEVKP